ncbi:MAG TPA: GTPase [Pirellulales bacterium]
MRFDLDDVIVAVGSAPGGAARGVVRLTGPKLAECLGRCFVAASGESLAEVSDPTSLVGRVTLLDLGRALPCDLWFWPDERSYTRQPIAELHTIGSPPLLDAAVRTLVRCGARLARPGEFTLRAFLAGRLDLTQAEAVLGVIEARGAGELDAALAQLAGGLRSAIGSLRDSLLDLLAELEAGLDFVEDDLTFIPTDEVRRRLAQAHDVVAALASQADRRGRTDDVCRVVLRGEPNVGKSSLFNRLIETGDAPSDASSPIRSTPGAIVSPVAGTTRDYLAARVSLSGVELELIDTAGLEDAESLRLAGLGPRAEAQRHAEAQAAGAHVVVLCFDATRSLSDRERAALAETADQATPRLVVLTKIDRVAANGVQPGEFGSLRVEPLRTSSENGAGLDELRSALRAAALATRRLDGGLIAATSARCAESLRTARESLSAALAHSETAAGDELIAADVRTAIHSLGEVVGDVYTDDLLDRIFSRFCIGK